MVTRSPRAFRSRPSDEAVSPLPSELATPPVTNTCFAMEPSSESLSTWRVACTRWSRRERRHPWVDVWVGAADSERPWRWYHDAAPVPRTGRDFRRFAVTSATLAPDRTRPERRRDLI